MHGDCVFKEKVVAKEEAPKSIKAAIEPVVKEQHGQPVTMEIQGMMCDHCKAKVTQALESVSGVSHVRVDVEANKANFEVNDSVTDKELYAVISEAGYKPETIERSTNIVVLPIEGMMCEHCVKRVNDALKSVAGVKSVQVDLDKAQAEVIMEKDMKIDALKTAVEKAGYQIKEE